MKHRLLSAIAVICGSLAVLTGEVGAQMKDLKKLRLNVFRIDAATAVARAQGLFAAEGLEVEASVTPNSTDQMRGISQGKYEMVSTAFDNVLAWSGREGAEIVTIAQISDKTVLPVFVRPEIKSWSDLKGKKLAADAVDTAFALVLRRVLLANGLDMTKAITNSLPWAQPARGSIPWSKARPSPACSTRPSMAKRSMPACGASAIPKRSCPIIPIPSSRGARVGSEKPRLRAWVFARVVEGRSLGQRPGQS